MKTVEATVQTPEASGPSITMIESHKSELMGQKQRGSDPSQTNNISTRLGTQPTGGSILVTPEAGTSYTISAERIIETHGKRYLLPDPSCGHIVDGVATYESLVDGLRPAVVRDNDRTTVALGPSTRPSRPLKLRWRFGKVTQAVFLVLLLSFTSCVYAADQNMKMWVSGVQHDDKYYIEMPGGNCGPGDIKSSAGSFSTQFIHNDICRIILTKSGPGDFFIEIETSGSEDDRFFVAADTSTPQVALFEFYADETTNWLFDYPITVFGTSQSGSQVGSNDHIYHAHTAVVPGPYHYILSAEHQDGGLIGRHATNE